jgi:nitrogen fixation/metabolism regulation signal transduction histidine kinase
MAVRLVRRLSTGTAPYFYLAILLLVLAYLLSAATADSSRLNDLFLVIFGTAGAALLLLITILIRSIYKLFRDFKNHQEGSRLTIRLVSLFVLLILGSTTIVYGFSMHFLHRGINSWFDVEIEQALNDSLELSRASFGIRMRTLLRQTRLMGGVLSELPDNELPKNIRELTQLSGAIELSVWTLDGHLVTSSGESPMIMVPVKPDESILRQLTQGEDYIGIDPGDNDKLQLRAAVRIPRISAHSEERILHVLFPISEHLSELGKTVQASYTDYKELSYLRDPLITIFTLALSLIVLLTVLMSIWFAIWISRRIVLPLQELSEGTQAVASGNYNMQLTASGQDEIGFLVRSFNQMTQRLTQARNASQRSHRLLEQQTNYLTTVLGSLSSGVITVDKNNYLKTANTTSNKILDINLQQRLESSLDKLVVHKEQLRPFILLLKQKFSTRSSWQEQLEITQKTGPQTLMCRGTPLPDGEGWVVVFDDITTLLQAQRSAAWGEVARRLAHEIKNPLTPIQLSAERLQYKYAPMVDEPHASNLTKLTSTIVQQVESMKSMVNDFSDYARNPGLQLQNYDFGQLIREVLTLYQSNPKHQFMLINPEQNITLKIDQNRMRQVLHNLLKNAIEASEEHGKTVDIVIHYQAITHNQHPWLEVSITDHGPGIPEDMLTTLFEPYVSKKAKGTGLGLAIVKKIVEEHHGMVWAENPSGQGASILFRIPMEDQPQ